MKYFRKVEELLKRTFLYYFDEHLRTSESYVKDTVKFMLE